MKRSRDSDNEDDAAGYGDDAAIVSSSKILNLDTDKATAKASAIECSLPGHARNLKFTDYHEYERHYIQTHTNRCLECGKNFPTSHIIGLHIQEHHDALAEMKREQGASTYACFVEACQDSFKSYNQRKEHLIKDHTYPHNYFFAVTKFGIDRRQSMLVEHRHRKNDQRNDPRPVEQVSENHAFRTDGQSCDTGGSKDVPMTDAEGFVESHQEAAGNGPVIEIGNSAEMQHTIGLTVGRAKNSSDAKPSERQTQQKSAVRDEEMDGLAGAMSSLRFVPRSIRLGPKQKAR